MKQVGECTVAMLMATRDRKKSNRTKLWVNVSCHEHLTSPFVILISEVKQDTPKQCCALVIRLASLSLE